MSDNVIHANPTKDFFIHMLTKDIPLIRAIIDLVDNSVDGALRLDRTNDYSGLNVDITVNETEFIIEDNCGGIPLEVARNYAFRFGRPPEAKLTPNSVGLFGVGMKRAIFKMGNYFEVESKTDDAHFIVKQDITHWSQTDKWEFGFENIENGQSFLSKIGTRIIVRDLHESISERFKLENFITELENQLQAAQQISLNKGLTIKVNGKKLKSQTLMFYASDSIKPGTTQIKLQAYPTVKIKIFVGIYERDLTKGGWYLFCNSRLVLYADQSIETGWDDASNGLPKYHPDFAYCRGYVYFESEDASLLPWNTTKTGIDTDSSIYKAVKQEMIKLMRPVTKWLRSNLAEEKKELGEEGELHTAIASAKVIDIFEIFEEQASSEFIAPKFIKPDTTGLVSIQYKVSRDKAEQAKKSLSVTSYSDVGRETFDYYYKWGIED